MNRYMWIFKFLMVHLFIFLWTICLSAQEKEILTMQDSIVWYADIMHNAEIPGHRLRADNIVSDLLYSSFLSDKDFSQDYTTVGGMKIIYNADSTFRIASWQVVDEEGTGRFNGLFQLQGETPLKLRDQSINIGLPIDRSLKGGKWIGIVYAEIIPYGSARDSTYILLGSGVESQMQWKHIAESFKILNRQPVFGTDAFHKNGKRHDREVLVFSAGSGASLHYIPKKNLIIFDDFDTVIDPRTHRHSSVPSGYYNGYILKKGIWEYEEEVQP